MNYVHRTFRFEAAHRLSKNLGRCANIHGHSYKVEVCLASDGLDENNMVVDFSLISAEVGEWIKQKWDHALLLNSKDDYVVEFANTEGFKYYPFLKAEPTAEKMAEELYWQLRNICSKWNEGLPKWRVLPKSVTVHETESCKAVYDGGESYGV